MRSRPNTKALATNESDDSEGDGEDKNDDGLTLDDEDSETFVRPYAPFPPWIFQ